MNRIFELWEGAEELHADAKALVRLGVEEGTVPFFTEIAVSVAARA